MRPRGLTTGFPTKFDINLISSLSPNGCPTNKGPGNYRSSADLESPGKELVHPTNLSSIRSTVCLQIQQNILTLQRPRNHRNSAEHDQNLIRQQQMWLLMHCTIPENRYKGTVLSVYRWDCGLMLINGRIGLGPFRLWPFCLQSHAHAYAPSCLHDSKAQCLPMSNSAIWEVIDGRIDQQSVYKRRKRRERSRLPVRGASRLVS